MNRYAVWDDLMSGLRCSATFLCEAFQYSIDSFHAFADSLASADEAWEQRWAAFLEETLGDDSE